MKYDKEKVDQVTLALMWLVTESDKYGSRAWKGFDWDTLDRLHEKGYISDPKRKSKSVALSDEAVELSEKFFFTLTLYFVGGFLFGASLAPGFFGKVDVNCHLLRYYSARIRYNSRLR